MLDHFCLCLDGADFRKSAKGNNNATILPRPVGASPVAGGSGRRCRKVVSGRLVGVGVSGLNHHDCGGLHDQVGRNRENAEAHTPQLKSPKSRTDMTATSERNIIEAARKPAFVRSFRSPSPRGSFILQQRTSRSQLLLQHFPPPSASLCSPPPPIGRENEQ